MKTILSPTEKARPVTPFLAAIALLGILFLAGCGRSENEPPVPTSQPESTATPSAIATPPQGESVTAPAPESSASSQAAVPGATPPKNLYVVTAFEAVSELGTHKFPVGAKVNIMEEDGNDYLVEYHGVAVRNGREFFSETMPGETAPPTIETTPPGTVTPPVSGLASSDATPDPAMAAEEKKSAELLGEIRTINDEIRRAEDAQKLVTTPDSETKESSKIKNLKKRRDALSEDLTDFAKP